MSVVAVPMSTRLTLRLNTGLDEEFNPVYRNRSWSNVKTGVNHETLHTLGTQFASLQVIPWTGCSGLTTQNLSWSKR